MKKCEKCSSENVISGDIVGSQGGVIEIKLKLAMFFSWTSPHVKIKGLACAECGHVAISIDGKELGDLRARGLIKLDND